MNSTTQLLSDYFLKSLASILKAVFQFLKNLNVGKVLLIRTTEIYLVKILK